MSEGPWSLPDDKLLRDCRIDSFVAAGPGGQHRNRKNTAVRVTHLPTKISAVATDSRSHRENQIHAIRELRHKLAMDLRQEIGDTLLYSPPPYFADYPALRMNPKNPLYPATVAEVLDVLHAMHHDLARAAVMLGLSTSALARFLHDDPALWQKVNQIRETLGLPPLRAR
jgi:hypothetical protein